MRFYSELATGLVKQGFCVYVEFGLTPAEAAASWLVKSAAANDPAYEIRPHQQRVLDKLDKTRGVIVAHSMGAGKTLTALIAAERAQKRNPNKMVTAVVPAPLVTNMLDQAKQYKVDLDPAHFQVMSYDKAVNQIPTLMAQDHSLVIFDEAHRVRNKGTTRSSQLDKLLRKADNTLFLTGTPAYNNPSDLAVLVNKVSGKELLPDDKREFEDRYLGRTQVSPGFFAHHVLGVPMGEVEHIKNKAELKRILAPHIDIYDAQEHDAEHFPTSSQVVVKVAMDKDQEHIYKFVEGNVPALLRWKIRMGLPLSKKESKDLNAFATGVRQASNSIAPYVTDPALKAHISPKIHHMAGSISRGIESDPNFRSVSYSNYLESGLRPLSRELTRRGIAHAVYDGSLSQAEKDKIVHQYNTGHLKSILISSSGAEGLNLKGTKLVQVMEPHFNRSKIDQIVARGVRYNSHMHLPEAERHVNVEHYQSVFHRGFFDKVSGSRPKTIDEYLFDVSNRKQGVQDEMKNMLKTASCREEAVSQLKSRLLDGTSEHLEKIYHGSPVSGLKQIDPRSSEVLDGEKAVFGTPDRDVAVSFLVPWNDGDFKQGSHNGQMYMRENLPGNFEKFFKGKSGDIYSMDSAAFRRDPRLTKFERIAIGSQKVQSKEHVEDALAELQKGNITMIKYHDVIPWGDTAEKRAYVLKTASCREEAVANLQARVLAGVGQDLEKRALDPLSMFALTAGATHLAQNAAVHAGLTRGGVLKAIGNVAEESRGANWKSLGSLGDFKNSETLKALSKLQHSSSATDSFYQGFHGKQYHPMHQAARSFVGGAVLPEADITARLMHAKGRQFRAKLEEANRASDAMIGNHPELAKYARPGNLTQHEKEFYGRVVSGDLIGAHDYYHHAIKGKSAIADIRINAAAEKLGETLNYDMKGVLASGGAPHRKVLHEASQAIQKNLLTRGNAKSLSTWREANEVGGSHKHQTLSDRSQFLATSAGNAAVALTGVHGAAVAVPNAIKNVLESPYVGKFKPSRAVQERLDNMAGTGPTRQAWARGVRGEEQGTFDKWKNKAWGVFVNPMTAASERLAGDLGKAVHDYHQVDHPGTLPTFSRYSSLEHLRSAPEGVMSQYHGQNVEAAVHNAAYQGASNSTEAARHVAAMKDMSMADKHKYLQSQGIDTKKIMEEESNTRKARRNVHVGATAAGGVGLAAAAALASRKSTSEA